MKIVMNFLFQSLFVFTSLLVMCVEAYACADIDGLVDVNCDRKLVIACFGDSITFGRADKPVQIGYPGRLVNYFPNALVFNLGFPGEKTPEGLSRASREFAALGAIDYIIVLEGTNDFFIKWSAFNTRNNLFNIVQRGQGVGAITLLATLTDIRRNEQKIWIRSVNNLIDQDSQIDFFALGDGIISSDTIHPGPTGYDAMAELVAARLQSVGAFNRPADTDADGIYDFAEVFFGSDKFDSDSDDDGLADGPEVFEYDSDPTLVDTDGDGFSDFREVIEMGSDPSDPRPGSPVLKGFEVVTSS